MAPQKKDATGHIVGPLKITSRTDQMDSSKRAIFSADCVCGATEHAALAVLTRYAGHGLTCPGHPLRKANESLDGITYTPDQSEYTDALAAWEAAASTHSIKEDPPSNSGVATEAATPITESATNHITTVDSTDLPESVDETALLHVDTEAATLNTESSAAPITTVDLPVSPASIDLLHVDTESITPTADCSPALTTTVAPVATSSTTESTTASPRNKTVKTTPAATTGAPVLPQDAPKAAVDSTTTPKISSTLKSRLGLVGYYLASIKLDNLKICGQDAVGATFAENSTGDRVLLHITLQSSDGLKRSIVSSQKKVSMDDWLLLTQTLNRMSIHWRPKDSKRVVAVAK